MKFWIFNAGDIHGPFVAKELSALPYFTADSLVCPEDLLGHSPDDWQRAKSFAEISAFLGGQTAAESVKKQDKTEIPAEQSAVAKIDEPTSLEQELKDTERKINEHLKQIESAKTTAKGKTPSAKEPFFAGKVEPKWADRYKKDKTFQEHNKSDTAQKAGGEEPSEEIIVPPPAQAEEPKPSADAPFLTKPTADDINADEQSSSHSDEQIFTLEELAAHNVEGTIRAHVIMPSEEPVGDEVKPFPFEKSPVIKAAEEKISKSDTGSFKEKTAQKNEEINEVPYVPEQDNPQNGQQYGAFPVQEEVPAPSESVQEPAGEPEKSPADTTLKHQQTEPRIQEEKKQTAPPLFPQGFDRRSKFTLSSKNIFEQIEKEQSASLLTKPLLPAENIPEGPQADGGIFAGDFRRKAMPGKETVFTAQSLQETRITKGTPKSGRKRKFIIIFAVALAAAAAGLGLYFFGDKTDAKQSAKQTEPAGSVKQKQASAINMVKNYELGSGRGTIKQWLRNSLVGSSAKGYQEDWTATILNGNSFVVQYKLTRAGAGQITYLFEADTEKQTVRGVNNPAVELLGSRSKDESFEAILSPDDAG